VTAPRAVGVHLPFDAVPAGVRDWVASTLGSPVVSAVDQPGGMSPGCVSRLVCADGTRAFLKAVGAELNPHSPALYRREVLALGLLGPHRLWADLLASYDGGGWVALLLEDVEGRHPDLADDEAMARLLVATDELGAAMAARVPDPPAPAAGPADVPPLYRDGPTDLRSVFVDWCASMDRVGDLPPDLAPAWLTARAPELRDGVAALVDVPADRVVHWDIRVDNLLRRPTGEIVFVDWGAFGVGPAWLDPLLARLERVDSPWFDASLASSAPLAEAGDDLVTSWLVGIGTHLAWRAHTAVDQNLPTLATFRRNESARFLAGAARRLGE
jgi:hypothetical protein